MAAPEEKCVLITGASGGIGRAAAEHLAAAGWDLVLHGAANESALADTAERCRTAGRRVATWLQDLSAADPTEGLAAAAAELPPMVGFVHAAGITSDGLAVRTKADVIERTVRINLTSAMALTAHLGRTLLKQRWGRICFVGSTAGLAGNAGQALYGATKAGLIGYARSLARELAPRNVTVNVVAPGWIETPMTSDILEKHRDEILASVPAGRVGKPDEVADAIGYLMSERSGYVTGQTLCVNGGLWMV